MPKVAKSSRTKTARKDPTKTSKTSNPKDSHLYTDDNPSTTIHGTGFKDRAAAERTLTLIKERSLIYQFQTVNTMYNRAKHHPAMKKAVKGSAGTADMQAAMDVFKEWLDVTYPAEKDSLRAGGFKPLLSKKTVQRYLSDIEANKSVEAQAKSFAKMYAELPRGKKLGNVLVDDSKPAEPDCESLSSTMLCCISVDFFDSLGERARYQSLYKLVPKGKEDDADAWKLSELWTDDRNVSAQHLQLIAWGWSPVAESKLP
jgi:hypothetical protein